MLLNLRIILRPIQSRTDLAFVLRVLGNKGRNLLPLIYCLTFTGWMWINAVCTLESEKLQIDFSSVKG